MRRSSRRHALLPPFLVALLLAVIPGCGSDPGGSRPHIVLVLVDQLRKDAADVWLRDVRALARRGVVFENMRSAAPWTYPSVISMFSGLYPQQHGADGAPDDGTLLSTFDARVPLFPALLRDEYHTAGFVTNPFLHTWNPFHLGFDHYAIDEFIGSQGPTRGNPEAVWTRDMFADSVNASVLAHYDARGAVTEPEFTYVHYIDVHGPWAGAPFDTGGALEKETAPGAREAAARYLDARIVELYEYFHGRYGGDLVFVVTSDHGMEMGDELEYEPAGYRQRKATVHDFNTHIPFFVLPGRGVASGHRVETPCSNVDVSPTVLELAGCDPVADVPGQSLVPAIRGDSIEARPIYSLQSAFGRRNDCVVVEGKKLFRHIDPASGDVLKLVYDLSADAEERAPIGSTFGEDGQLLQEAAGTGALHFEKRFVEPTAEDLENLRALGYLGEDAAATDEGN